MTELNAFVSIFWQNFTLVFHEEFIFVIFIVFYKDFCKTQIFDKTPKIDFNNEISIFNKSQ